MSGHDFSFEEFEAQLTYVLQHLYNPSLRPPGIVLHVLGLSAQDRSDALQTAVIQAVEDLRPADYVPKTARSWRVYSILYLRFISNLAQEEVAERVSITARHLRREQAGAIRVLALRFWENASLPVPDDVPEGEYAPPESPPASTEYQAPPEAQLKNDLLALQESAPGIISDVRQVIKSVLGLLERVEPRKSRVIEEIYQLNVVKAAIHPSALRQVLWMIIHQADTHLDPGTLSILCSVLGGKARINLVFTPGFVIEDSRVLTLQEILSVQNGVLSIQAQNDRVTFQIELINVNRTVLVVDDNPEIVHLYQRYLVGTAYHLVHLSKGQGIFENIAEIRPNIIILDIMLPDVDGWDLLTHLSENPETRSLPVIVCSVVTDPDLAAALGASACLSKPVQMRAFIQALDQVSSQV